MDKKDIPVGTRMTWQQVEDFISKNENAFETYINELCRLATSEYEDEFTYEDFLKLVLDKFGRVQIIKIFTLLHSKLQKEINTLKVENMEARKQLSVQQQAALDYALKTTDPISKKNERDELLEEVAENQHKHAEKYGMKESGGVEERDEENSQFKESGGEYKDE